MNVRTKGFCSTLLRCGEIKLIVEKREYAISDLIANIARTKRRRTKSFGRETLESVSSCTRFSGILKISNFGFNRSSSKLVGMFFGIVPMFVLKDFVQDCFVAQICAKMCVRAVIRAYLRDEAIRNKILGYEHWNYPKEHAYQCNFELKRLKPKLDIVKKPENRMHELTDSNVSPFGMQSSFTLYNVPSKFQLKRFRRS